MFDGIDTRKLNIVVRTLKIKMSLYKRLRRSN